MSQPQSFVFPTLSASDMSTADQRDLLVVQATALIVAAALQHGAIDQAGLSADQKKEKIQNLVSAVRTALASP